MGALLFFVALPCSLRRGDGGGSSSLAPYTRKEPLPLPPPLLLPSSQHFFSASVCVLCLPSIPFLFRRRLHRSALFPFFVFFFCLRVCCCVLPLLGAVAVVVVGMGGGCSFPPPKAKLLLRCTTLVYSPSFLLSFLFLLFFQSFVIAVCLASFSFPSPGRMAL